MTNTMEKQQIPYSYKIVTLNTNKWAVTFLAWYICTSLQGDVVRLVVRTYSSSHREMMLNVTHLSDMTINAVTILATILIFLCFLFSMGFRPWPFSFLFSMCVRPWPLSPLFSMCFHPWPFSFLSSMCFVHDILTF